MASKLFPVEVLREVVCDEHATIKLVSSKITDTSRWSVHYLAIFQDEDGRHYEAHYSRGATEYQDEGPFEGETGEIECTEVASVRRSVEVWEPAGAPAGAARRIRASKRQLLMQCPSSAIEADYVIETAKGPSDMGTIGHRALAHFVMTGEIPYEKIAADCAVLDLDAADVERVVERGACVWRRIQPDGAGLIHQVEVEQTLPEVEGMTGQVDVSWVAPMRASIVDWKLGFERRDAYHQVAQYAWLKRDQLRSEGIWSPEWVVQASLYWPRLGESQTWVFDDVELDSWRDQTIEREKEAGWVYSPGDHCGFCPNAIACRPRLEWLRLSVSAMSVVGADVVELEPATLGLYYDRAKAVERALGVYKGMIQSALDAGIVPLPDGRWLERGHRQVRQLNPDVARRELAALDASEEEIGSVIRETVKVGALDAIVKARADRGQKAIAIKDLNRRLADAGDLRYREDKLVCVKGDVTNV